MFKKLVVLLCVIAPSAFASVDKLPPKEVEWQFNGAFGTFNRQSIQRGFKVYKEVCAACHAIKHIAFRNLRDIGFSEEEVKSIAAGYNVPDGPNDEGEMFERPGRPSDHFPAPYVNEKAARAANNGAYPPDLSLIVKAREDGANYVYTLLTGFQAAPADFEVGENMHYNPYFAGGGKQLAMTPPLVAEGQIQYDDGTKATIDQMSKDMVNFLQWAAEPEMEQRKSLGIKVIIFLIIFTTVMYLAKVRIWRRIKDND